MMVDDFWFEGLGFDDLKSAAGNRDAIIAAVTTPRADRNTLQEALAGLERFLLFCRDLDELLATGNPIAAEAAFDLYRYWFDIRHGELAEVVDSALSALLAADVTNYTQQLPERTSLAALFERAKRTKRAKKPKL